MAAAGARVRHPASFRPGTFILGNGLAVATSFVSFVEGLINDGRHPLLTSLLLNSGYLAGRVIRNRKLQRLVLEGMMLSADRDNDSERRERLLLRFADKHKVTWPSVKAYVASGQFAESEALLETPSIKAEFRTAIRGWMLRADGKIDEAIAEFSALKPKNYDFKLDVTNALRQLYHQRQDHGMIATTLVTFSQSEPTRVLIKHNVAAAASAEAAHRDDLFAAAASRILDDIGRIVAGRSLFRGFWKDAVEGSVSVFDLDGALRIAQRAHAMRLPAAEILQDLHALIKDLQPILHVIDEARRDVLVRCGRQKAFAREGKAIVVVPAAALRSNTIDYPGFRADIRRCVKEIVAALEAEDVPYLVKARIRTHGTLDFDLPFFSYHTISDSGRGLQFKETDRRSLFSFDDHGYAGWSRFSRMSPDDPQIAAVDQETANRFFEEDRAFLVSSRQSKYLQKELSEALPERFIFAPLQVVGDAVQSLAFTTPFDMLDDIIAVGKREGLSVVVKRHPACRSPEISKYLSDHADDIIVTDGNIHDIIPASAAVCVINSGVGAEALTYEKPVYVFGRADYMSACHVCENKGDFLRTFIPGRTRLSAEHLRRFWYAYRTIYACDVKNGGEADWIHRRVKEHLVQNGVALGGAVSEAPAHIALVQHHG